MSITWIIVASVWGFGILCIIYSIITAKPYPEELETEEDEKIKKDFEEYKKGTINCPSLYATTHH